MKRSKKIIVLLGVLAGASAVTFGVTKYEEQKEKIKNSDEIILELDGDTVTSLSWEYDQEYLAFHKTDGKWFYDEDDAFPVDEEKIAELLEMFESFGVSFAIEEVEDFSQYGLDDPMCIINVATEDETYEIKLGDFSTMDSQRYVTMGDNNVYLVNKDPFDTFELTISDMIDNDETPDLEQVNEIQFAGASDSRIYYEKDSKNTYCDYDVYFMDEEGASLPLDTPTMNTYLRTIRNLGLEEYVTYNATEEELEKYGMDDPEMIVTIDHSWEDKDSKEEIEDTFVLNISRDPEEIKKAEKNDDNSDDADSNITAYARIGESQIIYKLDAEDYKTLMAVGYDDLRHKEILTADFSDITQFDISLEGTEYTISTIGNSEGRKYLFEEEELEIAKFKTALMDLEAESFTEETPTEKEEISITVYLDNENYPEIGIELYRYDGTNCLAMLDGESVALIPRSQVVELIEAVNAIVLN